MKTRDRIAELMPFNEVMGARGLRAAARQAIGAADVVMVMDWRDREQPMTLAGLSQLRRRCPLRVVMIGADYGTRQPQRLARAVAKLRGPR